MNHNHPLPKYVYTHIYTRIYVCASDSPTLLIFFPSKIAEVLRAQKFVCPYTEGAAGLICDLQQVSAALTERRDGCSSASHGHLLSYSDSWITAVQTKPLIRLVSNFCICITTNRHDQSLSESQK